MRRFHHIRRLAGLAALAGAAVRAEPPSPALGPVAESDPAFLRVPEPLVGRTDFAVADRPPRITFSSVGGLDPLPPSPDALWGCWGEGVTTAENRILVAMGNNALRGGNSVLYEYDPDTHRHRRVFDLAKFLRQKPGELGHSKLHGRLDETADGWVYLVTYPNMTDETPAAERLRFGSRIVRYNVRTQEAEDFGTPIPGDCYPMNTTDAARGRVFGVGLFGTFLAWDAHAKRPVYAGPLPGDLRWASRAVLVDPRTGFCYGNDPVTRRIVRYDPVRNTFSPTRAVVPAHPVAGKDREPAIRAYTRNRLRDGSFVVMTSEGAIFKFFPDEERTQPLGVNFADGFYCSALALSADERYLYYAVGPYRPDANPIAPVIRFDLETGTPTVLAFLASWYAARHQYHLGLAFSACLDRTGRRLLLVWNGRFTRPGEKAHALGHPAFICLDIDPPAANGAAP